MSTKTVTLASGIVIKRTNGATSTWQIECPAEAGCALTVDFEGSENVKFSTGETKKTFQCKAKSKTQFQVVRTSPYKQHFTLHCDVAYPSTINAYKKFAGNMN